MSTLCFFTSITNWSSGELVCVNSSGEAVRYDSQAPLPVVGVSIKPSENYYLNGRQWFAINGSPYYENDFYEWKDDLTSDFVTENNNYAPFNPIGDAGYISAITHGFAAVQNTISAGIPAGWVKIKSKTDYDWYLVR
jgi:hypothetical protein